jgi:hypothetical protein
MKFHLWARFKRFWHTLFNFHRALDYWREETHRPRYFGSCRIILTKTYIGCECGKRFWEDPVNTIADVNNRDAGPGRCEDDPLVKMASEHEERRPPR